MKHTLITESIDGYEVVCGLGRPVIDPQQAKALLAQEIPDSAEYQQYLKLINDHKILISGLALLVEKKRLLMQGDEIMTAIQNSDEYKNFVQVKAAADLTTDAGVQALTAAWNAYKLKEKEIASANANVNSALLETQEYADWFQACDTANIEIKTAYQEVSDKKRSLVESADIFFTPKAGEEIVTDEDAALHRSRLEAGQRVGVA